MRPMPPNATQMTSMITMQQPVHATTVVATATTGAAPATITTSSAASAVNQASKPQQQTSSSLKQQQQQQQQQVANVGGQRTAIKLSSRPPVRAQQADPAQQQQHWQGGSRQPSRQQSSYAPNDCPSIAASTNTSGSGANAGPLRVQQQQQQQQQPQQQQPPAQQTGALENSAISGLNTTTTNTTSTSQATGVHERPPLETADDNPSECSCSNSFDYSLDEPTHSTSSHLEEPLLGGGPPVQPMINHYPHAAHHHEHAHLHRGPPSQHPPHRNQHAHIIYNDQRHRHQPVPQSFQPLQHTLPAGYHKARQELAHHSAHGFPQQLHHQQAPPHHHFVPAPLYAGGPVHNPMQHPPPPPPISANNHSHQHRHRPLVPRASMPTAMPSGARAYLDQSPPFVRHSTYAATSDTITDESIHRQQHNHAAYAPQTMTSDGPHPSPSESPPDHTGHYYPSSNPNCTETELLVGKRGQQQHARREISFRRSATTREDENNRWHRQQSHGHNEVISTRTLPLERNQNSGPSAHQPSHQRSTSRLASGPTPNSQKSTHRRHHYQQQQAQQEVASSFHYHDGGQQRQSPIPAPAGSFAPAAEGQAVVGTNSVIPSNTNLLLGAQQAASALPHSVSPIETAATFCPPMLAPPSSLPPIGPLAITSHRTNSPWMRLSSIILTPVGIVIVLFIVVSPLLHYLM